MQYPLVSEYIEAIRSAEDNLDQLSDLRPVLDNRGNPYLWKGSHAVVFKMQDVNTKRLYAVKCFTHELSNRNDHYQKIAERLQLCASPYLLHFRFIQRELFVDTSQSDEEYFPVLVMDWAEGITLDSYLKLQQQNNYALQLLAYRFCRMCAWLLAQPFAHGDLKPTNILVKEDGSLVLVDYDGMYVPALHEATSNEIGHPDFRHPLRTEALFNEHIDDFAIASIALSLKAIALQPSLYAQFATADRLLFSANDYLDLGRSAALQAILALASDAELSSLLSAFLLAASKNSLGLLSYRLFALQEPDKAKVEVLRTNVGDEDRSNAVRDEYGVLYSPDGFRLIEAPWWALKLEFYKIKEGTKVICDGAFLDCRSLKGVSIPSTVTSIGDNPFCGCSSLQIVCGSPYYTTTDNLLISNSGKLISCLSNKEHILIPNTVSTIGNSAFYRCKYLQSINIPNSVTTIGECAFHSCSSLQNISIPDTVTSIENKAFAHCKALQSMSIPNSVTSIGEGAFASCISLQSINIHKSVVHIGSQAFSWCKSLQDINIPSSVDSIGDSTFYNCKSLRNVSIPESVTAIGDFAFYGCKSLKSVSIPNGAATIGDSAFFGCDALQQIKVPRGTLERFKKMIDKEHQQILT